MILYNVTIIVEHAICEEWLEWMQKEHMPGVMNTGLFLKCKLFKLLNQNEEDGLTYAAQYFCENIDKYDTYINEFAAELREKTLSKFGGKIVTFRTILEKKFEF